MDGTQGEHGTAESQFEEALDAQRRREDNYEDEEVFHVVFEEPAKSDDCRNVPISNNNHNPKPRLPTESTVPRLLLLELEVGVSCKLVTSGSPILFLGEGSSCTACRSGVAGGGSTGNGRDSTVLRNRAQTEHGESWNNALNQPIFVYQSSYAVE